MAAPMPLDAPVTTATLPASGFSQSSGSVRSVPCVPILITCAET
jgi:hypothetical protein